MRDDAPLVNHAYNLSFWFFRYEKRRGLEANFVHLVDGNSQAAIFENKCTKFDRENTFFRVEKPKTQVDTSRYSSSRRRSACG
jgi:hypothetical protein